MDSSSQADFLQRVGAHEGVLRRLAAVYARNPSDRDDLLQDMLVQLWRSFGSFRDDASFSTWMYRVALNTALMGRRSGARRPEARVEETVVEALPGASGNEDVRDLYSLVRALPELDRAVVALWLEGHSYEEIAEVTGLGRSNVSVRLVRAKEKLRTAVEREAS
jgi:RNA polymerase sigma-70 factor (ECF subfamily)